MIEILIGTFSSILQEPLYVHLPFSLYNEPLVQSEVVSMPTIAEFQITKALGPYISNLVHEFQAIDQRSFMEEGSSELKEGLTSIAEAYRSS